MLFSAGRQSADPPATLDRGAVAVLENGATSVEGQRAVALARTERDTQTNVPLPASSLDAGLAASPSPGPKQILPTDRDAKNETHVQETYTPVVEQEPQSDRIRLSMPVAGESGEKTLQIESPAQEDRSGKAHAGMAPAVRTDAASWASHKSARFGFTVRYPADIFVLEPAESDEHVMGFRSGDGRATLRIFGTPNVAARTLAQYRKVLIQERYAKATLDYAPQRETWFVLSGVAGDDIFYERVTFSCDRRLFHGWRLVFPSSERLLYEPIIDEMHRNYRHSNGPGGRCGAVKPQVSEGPKSSSGASDGSL